MIQIDTLDINQHGFDKKEDFDKFIPKHDSSRTYSEDRRGKIAMNGDDNMSERTRMSEMAYSKDNIPTTPTSSKVSNSDGSAVSNDTSPSSVDTVDGATVEGQSGSARNSTLSYSTIVNKSIIESRTADGITRSNSSIHIPITKELPQISNGTTIEGLSNGNNDNQGIVIESFGDGNYKNNTADGITTGIVESTSKKNKNNMTDDLGNGPSVGTGTNTVEEPKNKLTHSITFSGLRSGSNAFQFKEIKQTPSVDRRYSSPLTPIQRKRRSFDIDPKQVDLSSSNRINQISSRNSFPVYSGANNGIPHISRNSTSLEILRMRSSILSKKNRKKRLDSVEDDKVLVGNKISEGHVNFVLAYNMLTGIRVAVSRCSGVMQKLTDKDFENTKKLSFNLDGSELTPSSKYDFKFKDYCPEVFRELRTLFGLDPADYLISITGKYILSELTSPGKSGSFFYYSRDYRFIIKTVHHSEHKQLRKILKDYYKHVKDNPNTLISQFYGLHRVKMPYSINGRRKIHFIVMNNLFPPHRDIHLKYDLKGSTWGRSTKYKNDNELSNITLKDLNWLERNDRIKFGPNKRKLFFDQLEADVKFLKKVNVMDYSLLLGVHDVKQGNTFDLTQKLSVFDPKSTDPYELIHTNPRFIDRANDLPSNVFPGRMKYVFYGHDGGIRATDENNEPLSEIYYLGIIDCLTNYSLKKRLETFWRVLGHSRSSISAVPASEYGNRFLNFISKGTTNEKSKVL